MVLKWFLILFVIPVIRTQYNVDLKDMGDYEPLEGAEPLVPIGDSMTGDVDQDEKCTIKNLCTADEWPWWDQDKRDLPSMDHLLVHNNEPVPNLYYYWCRLPVENAGIEVSTTHKTIQTSPPSGRKRNQKALKFFHRDVLLENFWEDDETTPQFYKRRNDDELPNPNEDLSNELTTNLPSGRDDPEESQYYEEFMRQSNWQYVDRSSNDFPKEQGRSDTRDWHYSDEKTFDSNLGQTTGVDWHYVDVTLIPQFKPTSNATPEIENLDNYLGDYGNLSDSNLNTTGTISPHIISSGDWLYDDKVQSTIKVLSIPEVAIVMSTEDSRKLTQPKPEDEHTDFDYGETNQATVKVATIASNAVFATKEESFRLANGKLVESAQIFDYGNEERKTVKVKEIGEEKSPNENDLSRKISDTDLEVTSVGENITEEVSTTKGTEGEKNEKLKVGEDSSSQLESNGSLNTEDKNSSESNLESENKTNEPLSRKRRSISFLQIGPKILDEEVSPNDDPDLISPRFYDDPTNRLYRYKRQDINADLPLKDGLPDDYIDPDFVIDNYNVESLDKVCTYRLNRLFSFPNIHEKNYVLIIPGWESDHRIDRLYKAIGVEFALLKYNVIFIDWLHLQMRYEYGVANARGVAIQIYKFFLSDFVGLTEDNAPNQKYLHIVGGGIGAHIAGYLGQVMKIQRITALDPERIYFDFPGASPDIILNKENADFVDVYHTDFTPRGFREYFGYPKPMGHVDFWWYPESYEQSYIYCPRAGEGYVTNDTYPLCEHHKVLEIFLDSMKPDCLILGMRKDWNDNVCSVQSCLLVGLPAYEMWDERYSPKELDFSKIDCKGNEHKLDRDFKTRINNSQQYFIKHADKDKPKAKKPTVPTQKPFDLPTMDERDHVAYYDITTSNVSFPTDVTYYDMYDEDHPTTVTTTTTQPTTSSDWHYFEYTTTPAPFDVAAFTNYLNETYPDYHSTEENVTTSEEPEVTSKEGFRNRGINSEDYYEYNGEERSSKRTVFLVKSGGRSKLKSSSNIGVEYGDEVEEVLRKKNGNSRRNGENLKRLSRSENSTANPNGRRKHHHHHHHSGDHETRSTNTTHQRHRNKQKTSTQSSLIETTTRRKHKHHRSHHRSKGSLTTTPRVINHNPISKQNRKDDIYVFDDNNPPITEVSIINEGEPKPKPGFNIQYDEIANPRIVKSGFGDEGFSSGSTVLPPFPDSSVAEYEDVFQKTVKVHPPSTASTVKESNVKLIQSENVYEDVEKLRPMKTGHSSGGTDLEPNPFYEDSVEVTSVKVKSVVTEPKLVTENLPKLPRTGRKRRNKNN